MQYFFIQGKIATLINWTLRDYKDNKIILSYFIFAALTIMHHHKWFHPLVFCTTHK